MKKVLVICCLLVGLAFSTNGWGQRIPSSPEDMETVPIDAEAQFVPERMRDMSQKAAYLVVSDGYKCDSISLITKVPEQPLTVYCNHSNYRYRIYAAGGRIKVVPTN